MSDARCVRCNHRDDQHFNGLSCCSTGCSCGKFQPIVGRATTLVDIMDTLMRMVQDRRMVVNDTDYYDHPMVTTDSGLPLAGFQTLEEAEEFVRTFTAWRDSWLKRIVR